jgi:hypothetical protein
MAKNSREGNRERAARRRTGLATRGLEQFQVIAPSEAKSLIRQAVDLMIRKIDPVEPRAALRQVGGTNEPEPASTAPDVIAELEAARARITTVEGEAESRRLALEAELGIARAAAAEAEEKRQEIAISAQEASKSAKEALRRANRTEKVIRQVRDIPGLRGRLVRWLASDVLPD